MSPVLHLKPGTIFAEDFRIVSPLNAGGMGAVYVADQLSTGFQRALKIMLPELLADQELRDRFLREARVCARIQSDHVVQVVAAGIDQPTSTPWLAMELLRGEDLSEYIARRERVTPSGLVEIYRQLCHALGAAHAVGVVHRDLKPENIFLSVSKRAGAPFTVKVLDFGIAKMIADASAKMTALIGSPLWMAPEQMDPRSQISPATDVWALALLGFWLLTGDHYWRSAKLNPLSMHAIMREVLFDPLATASERASELGFGDRIPPGFSEWCAHCLVRDPAARLQTANDALDDLERSLGIGPRGTMPHPPSLSGDSDGSVEEIGDDLSDAGYEPPASETAPPTLHSSTEEGRGAPAPSPAPSVASPTSSGPPTSMNGVVASGERARRSSIPSVLPMKSTAPLWMLAAGLVMMLVVIIVFVKQRTSALGTTTTSGPVVTTAQPTLPPPMPLAPASTITVPIVTATPAPSTVPTGEPSFEANKSFNPTAATAALKAGAAAARECKRSYGPTGPGSVKVTFGPTGNVTSALLITPQYSGSLVGTCVANQFLKLRVPPFEGTPVTTNMPFDIPP